MVGVWRSELLQNVADGRFANEKLGTDHGHHGEDQGLHRRLGHWFPPLEFVNLKCLWALGFGKKPSLETVNRHKNKGILQHLQLENSVNAPHLW